MAYLSASMPHQHKETFSFSSYDDLFDQYVEYLDSDSYGLSDNSTDRSTSDEWEKYFDLPDSSSGSDAIALSPQLNGQHSPDLGQALWADADVSDRDLFSSLLHTPDIDRQRSLTPDTCNSPTSKARPSKHRKSYSLDLNKPRSAGVRKPSQRGSVSPKMAQPPVSRQRSHDTWAQRIEANADRFDFSNQDYFTTFSPPPSAPLPQMTWDESNFSFNNATTSRGASSQADLAFPLSQPSLPAHAHFSPLSSPTLDTKATTGAQYVQSPTSTYFPDHIPPPSIDWSLSRPSFELPFGEAPSFQTETNTTLSAGTYPADTIYSNPDASFPGWLTALPAHPANHGLMIHSSSTAYAAPAQPHSRSLSDTHKQHFQSSTFVRPQTSQQRPPQLARQRMSQPPPSPSCNSRSRPPTPPATPRSRKGSKGPTSHHKRSKTATGIGRSQHPSAGAGFVNYTPDDSRKILTGVAPSGSSKTKARREKEAQDRKRLLSIAAAKAVMEAGGDVEELRRCGFLA